MLRRSFYERIDFMFAKTIDELKQDLIDHLATVDKTKLNMMDLNGCTTVLKMLDDMLRPDPSEYLKETMQMISNGYGNFCCTTDEIDKMKVGVLDG